MVKPAKDVGLCQFLFEKGGQHDLDLLQKGLTFGEGKIADATPLSAPVDTTNYQVRIEAPT